MGQPAHPLERPDLVRRYGRVLLPGRGRPDHAADARAVRRPGQDLAQDGGGNGFSGLQLRSIGGPLHDSAGIRCDGHQDVPQQDMLGRALGQGHGLGPEMFFGQCAGRALRHDDLTELQNRFSSSNLSTCLRIRVIDQARAATISSSRAASPAGRERNGEWLVGIRRTAFARTAIRSCSSTGSARS